jgi:hypothetical protein
MNPIISPIILGILIAFGFFSMWRIAKYADFVHTSLDELQRRAQVAEGRDELFKLYKDLTIFYNRYCYVRHFSSYAFAVRAYIEGRLAKVTHD